MASALARAGSDKGSESMKMHGKSYRSRRPTSMDCRHLHLWSARMQHDKFVSAAVSMFAGLHADLVH